MAGFGWRRKSSSEIPVTSISGDPSITVNVSDASSLSALQMRSRNPHGAIGSDGTLIVVWEQTDGETMRIHTKYSRDSGATWSRVTDIASAPFVYGPRVAIMWSNFDGVEYRLKVSTSSDGGALWSRPDTALAVADVFSSTHILVGSDAQFVAVWNQDYGEDSMCA
jgi:hypothetical protein